MKTSVSFSPASSTPACPQRLGRYFSSVFVAAALDLFACTGYGEDFKVADGQIEGQLKNRLSAGAGMRVQNPSRHLVGKGFASDGRPKGGNGADTSDDGNLNYRRGDVFSTPFKLVSELDLHHGQTGIDVSTRIWDDPDLKNAHVRQGNKPNGFQPHHALKDTGFDKANRFSGIMLLNAYAYTHFDFDDEKARALDLRVGKQTLDWGEDLFVQNIDQINPRDYTNLHRPGTDAVSELRLPVEMLWARWRFTKDLNLETYYQWKWRPSEYDPCGTFFGGVDLGFDPGCNSIQSNAYYPLNAYSPGAGPWLSDGYMLSKGAVLPVMNRRRGSNGGQWGAALHYHIEAIDTELGLYYMNLNSRTPYLDAYAFNPAMEAPGLATSLMREGIPASDAALSQHLTGLPVGWAFPDNIHITGLSLATHAGGWRIAGEVSYTSNLPVALNTSDMFSSLTKQIGPLRARAEPLAPGGLMRGYDRFNKTQWQLNARRKLAPMLHAQGGQIAAEVVWSHVNLPSLGQARYGRGFAWGFSPQYSEGSCTPVQNPQGCVSKGYYTRDALAYRLRGQLDYAMPGHWTLSPSLLWAQDLRGYSVDNQIVEGRKLLSLGLAAKWRRYQVQLSYSGWLDTAAYDPFKDHDFVSLAFSAIF